MSILSQLPILSILAPQASNPTTDAAGGASEGLNLDLGLVQISAPALDLGAVLNGSEPLLTAELPILDPVLDALGANVDLTTPLASVSTQNGLSITVGSDTPTVPGTTADGATSPDISLLPGIDLDIDLGLGGGTGGSPPPSTGTGPSLPGIDLDVDLDLGGGTGGTPSPSTGVDPVPTGPIGGGPTNPGGIPSGPVDTGSNPGSGPTTGVGAGSVGELSIAQSIDWAARETLEGNASDNTLMGLSGNDTIYGHGGDDVIYGNQNDDKLYGGLGNDTLHGGRDNDFVSGDEGDDELWGEYGNDTFEGGDGADMFCFGGQADNDIILDFNAAEGDRLNFCGQEYAFHEVGGSAVITLSGGGTVMLNGVSTANLDAFIVG